MSRSVSTHRHAVGVAYIHLDNLVDSRDESGFEWQQFREDVENVLTGEAGVKVGRCKGYPSLTRCDRWKDREDHVILENSRFEVSLSEYCGCVAVCIAPIDPGNALDVCTAENANRNFSKLIAKAFPNNALVSQGRASNGEQFFQLAAEPGSCVTSKEGRLW